VFFVHEVVEHPFEFVPNPSKHFLLKLKNGPPLPMLTCDFVLTLLTKFSDVICKFALAAPTSALPGMKIVRFPVSKPDFAGARELAHARTGQTVAGTVSDLVG
jgi:hypothetical protein